MVSFLIMLTMWATVSIETEGKNNKSINLSFVYGQFLINFKMHQKY